MGSPYGLGLLLLGCLCIVAIEFRKESKFFHLMTISRTSLVHVDEFTADELDILDRTLNSAKMEGGTVILTTINEAWSSEGSMVDLFLESFRSGNGTQKLLDHLVFVAMDLASYERCLQIHRHCFRLDTPGVDFSGGEKRVMTDSYFMMMWRRTYFLSIVLKLGYSFVFTDSDIVWLQDPFKHLHKDVDFELACDKFMGNEDDLEGSNPNAGFLHAICSNRTVKLYELWYNSRLRYPGRNEQDVYNLIRHSPEFQQLGLKLKYLSTDVFSGMCERSKDMVRACTFHANCCVGLNSKIAALKLAMQKRKEYLSVGHNEAPVSTSPWADIKCPRH